MLTEEKIGEIRKDIKERKNRLDVLEKKSADEIATRNSGWSEIKKMEEKISSIQKNNQSLNIAIHKNTSEIEEHKRKILAAGNMLEEDAKEKAINALVDEQPYFWEAAEVRLAKIQEELSAELPDFANFVDPEDAIKNIRSIAEAPRSFGGVALFIRNTNSDYTNYIRDLCEKKHNGVAIPLSLQRQKTVILDNFLNSQPIEGYWSKG